MTKSRCVCVRKRPQSFARVEHAREPKMVAKRRTVVSFGLVFGLRVSKVSTITGIWGGMVAKRGTVVILGGTLREKGKGQESRREESRGGVERGQGRDDRGERGEDGGERREERGEKRRERGERGEERGEEREEKRERRRKRRKG